MCAEELRVLSSTSAREASLALLNCSKASASCLSTAAFCRRAASASSSASAMRCAASDSASAALRSRSVRSCSSESARSSSITAFDRCSWYLSSMRARSSRVSSPSSRATVTRSIMNRKPFLISAYHSSIGLAPSADRAITARSKFFMSFTAREYSSRLAAASVASCRRAASSAPSVATCRWLSVTLSRRSATSCFDSAMVASRAPRADSSAASSLASSSRLSCRLRFSSASRSSAQASARVDISACNSRMAVCCAVRSACSLRKLSSRAARSFE
mmetsp:Transcript_99320/g.241557  ORF Transcript_99320/g.241557 Transcript_99320/m.241557 type:complete len:275 (+) Transcript_99320:293-1117(+)